MTYKFKRAAVSTLSALLLAGAAMPMVALATGDHHPPIEQPSTRRPDKANLILHKLQFHGEEAPTILNHDGTKTTVSGTEGLNGITFKIWKVADDARSKNVPETAPLMTLETATIDGEVGVAEFNNLLAGRYLVVEDTEELPHGVNYTTDPFLVDVPMTNAAGTDWLDEVHVYPKNRLILATVDFYKHFEYGEDNPDSVASFELWKEGDTERLDVATTGVDGRVFFNNQGFGLETGEYYIKEISVSDPYGLNEDNIEFTVGNDDHDADLADDIASMQLLPGEVFDNFILPDPDKVNLDDDNDDFSANYKEAVTWELNTRIPKDIADYEVFKFTDKIDSRLNYAGNITYYINGEVVTDIAPTTLTEPTMTGGGTLIIGLDVEKLAKYAGKELAIRFDTKINIFAKMGEKIPNKFELDFNNGSGLIKKTIENPPYTRTGGAKFDKTSNSTKANLKGAEFWVYRLVGDEKHYLQADYTWNATNPAPMVLKSDEKGHFDVKGLSFGTYYLEERVALPGHMLAPDFKFDVDADSYNVTDPQDVLNKTQIKLPETGGIGTIAFTIAGLGMMAGAVKLYKKEEK